MSDIIISKKNEIELNLECEQHILYELQEDFSFDVEGASFSPAYQKEVLGREDKDLVSVCIKDDACRSGLSSSKVV